MPPKKRKLSTSADDALAPRELDLGGAARDEEFWFDDGTVILVAGNVQFKVYRGVLADQSAVFRELFSIPQRKDPAEPEERCPVVHLPDSAHDLRQLLGFFLPGRRGDALNPKNTISKLCSLARLGHAYQIKSVLDQSLAELLSIFGTDFDEWMGADEDNSEVVGDNAIEVVNIARLTGTPQLLPTAFLYLNPDVDVTDGYRRADGTLEELSPEDIRRCYRVTLPFARAAMNAAMEIVWRRPLNPQCTDRRTCFTSLQNIAGRLRPDAESIIPAFFFDGPWSEFVKAQAAAHPLCGSCVEMIEAREREELRKIWNRLPDMLDLELDGWPAPKQGAGPAPV